MQKYMINIKPTAPKLNVYIKTHKEKKTVTRHTAPEHTSQTEIPNCYRTTIFNEVF
jgi:hypothetical protein